MPTAEQELAELQGLAEHIPPGDVELLEAAGVPEHEVTAGDALVAIAGVEPSALKLVGDIMECNARSLQHTFEQLYEGEKRAHEQTQEELRHARARLRLIESRILWLLGYDEGDVA